MTEQEMVDRFAELAKPRVLELLKLKIPHVYDETPGTAMSKVMAANRAIGLKLERTIQPYALIERLTTDEKVTGFIINPGLVPLVKAMAFDIRGRQLLVTRRIAAKAGEKGAIAHVEGFGIQIGMRFDSSRNETQVIWECLYGVA